MSNLTITGSHLLLAGVRRANFVYLTWEPATVYYQDYAYSWHKSTLALSSSSVGDTR